MNIRNYHNKTWIPFTKKLDKIHFTILAILQILAAPENDLDCYTYAFKRTKNCKYKNMKLKERIKAIIKLIKYIIYRERYNGRNKMDIKDIKTIKNATELKIEELLEELQNDTNTKVDCVEVKISTIKNFEGEKNFIEDINIKLTI